MTSKVNEESQRYQVNQLIYSLECKADEILTTSHLALWTRQDMMLPKPSLTVRPILMPPKVHFTYEHAQFMR